MNAVLEAVRQMVLAKREDSTNDLYLRTLELRRCRRKNTSAM